MRESPPIEQAMIRRAEHQIEPAKGGQPWEALLRFACTMFRQTYCGFIGKQRGH